MPSLRGEDLRARIHGHRPPPDFERARKALFEQERLTRAARAANEELDMALYDKWASGADIFEIARALRLSRKYVARRVRNGARIAVERQRMSVEDAD